MEQMGRGMIQHRGGAPLAIDLQDDAAAALELSRVAAQKAPDVNNRAVLAARVGDLENRAARGFDHAAIADLAAALGIEGRLGDRERKSGAVVAAAGHDFGLGCEAMVLDEARGSAGAQNQLGRGSLALARRAGTLALLVHQAVELGNIDLKTLVPQDVLRQIERKSVGVVKLKSDVAGEALTFYSSLAFAPFGQQLKPTPQGLLEAKRFRGACRA